MFIQLMKYGKKYKGACVSAHFPPFGATKTKIRWCLTPESWSTLNFALDAQRKCVGKCVGIQKIPPFKKCVPTFWMILVDFCRNICRKCHSMRAVWRKIFQKPLPTTVAVLGWIKGMMSWNKVSGQNPRYPRWPNYIFQQSCGRSIVFTIKDN